MQNEVSPDAPIQTLGFFARLWLCASLEMRLLFDGALAWRLKQAVDDAPPALPPHQEDAAPKEELESKDIAKESAEMAALKKELDALTRRTEREETQLEKAETKLHEVGVELQTLLDAPPSADAALHLLAIFQRDGRFIDFLEEDVTGFSDAEVGGAARLVHQGCKKALDQYFTLEPLSSEAEESAMTVEAGFDANTIRLTGNVGSEPPYKGTLAHPGWRATKAELPSLPEEHDASILAPIEVEI